MDALAVVRHLHSLAEKPENRSTIVKVIIFFTSRLVSSIWTRRQNIMKIDNL